MTKYKTKNAIVHNIKEEKSPAQKERKEKGTVRLQDEKSKQRIDTPINHKTTVGSYNTNVSFRGQIITSFPKKHRALQQRRNVHALTLSLYLSGYKI